MTKSEKLLDGLLKVSLGTAEHMLSDFLKVIYDVTECKMCSLWKINHDRRFLSVQERKGYTSVSQDRGEFILAMDSSLLGYLTNEILKNKESSLDIHSMKEPKYWQKIKRKEFANMLGLDRIIVISIPTLSASINEKPSIETILAIYPKDNDSFKNGCIDIIRGYLSLTLSRLNSIKREQITQNITEIYEKKVAKDLVSILEPITTNELKKYIEYEGCSVFQWDPFLNRLSLVQTTGMEEKDNKQNKKSDIFYYLDEGITGYIAKKKETLVYVDLDVERPKECLQHKWQEKTEHSAKTFIGIPIMSPSRSNELLGVIRFTNKLNQLEPSIVDYFNEQDIALIKQACNLIALYMEGGQNERIHTTVAKKMAHEMMTPTVAIRGTTSRLLRKWNVTSFPKAKIDSYLKSILDHVELQIALTRNVQFSGRIDTSRQAYYQIGRCDFQKEVIEHSKKLVIPTAVTSRLSFDQIFIKGLFPQLFIDKYAFQQIFFNLLTNSIKYRDMKLPNEFKIIIESYGIETYQIPEDAQGYEKNKGQKQRGFLFSIKDYGIGIASDQKSKIFQMGYRIYNVEKVDIRGLGMGLAVVEQILKDFYGNIWLAEFENPTEFKIFLPKTLRGNQYTKTDEWKME